MYDNNLKFYNSIIKLNTEYIENHRGPQRSQWSSVVLYASVVIRPNQIDSTRQNPLLIK